MYNGTTEGDSTENEAAGDIKQGVCGTFRTDKEDLDE